MIQIEAKKCKDYLNVKYSQTIFAGSHIICKNKDSDEFLHVSGSPESFTPLDNNKKLVLMKFRDYNENPFNPIWSPLIVHAENQPEPSYFTSYIISPINAASKSFSNLLNWKNA